MKISYAIVVVGTVVLFNAGCASMNQDTQGLIEENKGLKQELQSQERTIQGLSREKDRLTEDLDYCTKRTEVLEKEKTARIDEASQTRKGVREFTDQVMNSLQTYFQKAEVVDYIGGELIARDNVDNAKNLLLVDLGNPLRADGTVIGGRAYLTGPSRLQFCLLRTDAEQTKFTIVSITPPIIAADAGSQSWSFEVPMAGQKGDLIGLYLPDDASIPYDAADTGHVVVAPGPAKLNSAVTVKVGSARNKRAYSFGVVGYFESSQTEEESSQ
ncbi:MAG TPA: hypothetical protein VIH35_10170 [Kiritimatiellia bacterium]|jgi:hypothetical protein